MFIYVRVRLEAESEARRTVRDGLKLLGISIIPLSHQRERIADIEAESPEAAVAESQLTFIRIEAHSIDTGKSAHMEFDHLTQVPSQHQTRSQ